MKKVIKTCNKPIVIVGALISAIAVILAKFFMTKAADDEKED